MIASMSWASNALLKPFDGCSCCVPAQRVERALALGPTARPTARALRSPTRQGGTRGRPRRRRPSRRSPQRRWPPPKPVGTWYPSHGWPSWQALQPASGDAGRWPSLWAGPSTRSVASEECAGVERFLPGFAGTTSQCSAMRPSRTRNRSTVATRAALPSVDARMHGHVVGFLARTRSTVTLLVPSHSLPSNQGKDRRLGSPSELCAPGISRKRRSRQRWGGG